MVCTAFFCIMRSFAVYLWSLKIMSHGDSGSCEGSFRALCAQLISTGAVSGSPNISLNTLTMDGMMSLGVVASGMPRMRILARLLRFSKSSSWDIRASILWSCAVHFSCSITMWGRVSSKRYSRVSILPPRCVVSAFSCAKSCVKAFSILAVNRSRSSLVGRDQMWRLRSPSPRKSVGSGPCSREDTEPGDAGGAESLTDRGNGIGDVAISGTGDMLLSGLHLQRHLGSSLPGPMGLREVCIQWALPHLICPQWLGECPQKL